MKGIFYLILPDDGEPNFILTSRKIHALTTLEQQLRGRAVRLHGTEQEIKVILPDCEIRNYYDVHEWRTTEQEYEFKIKIIGDNRKWEEIPISITKRFISDLSANTYAQQDLRANNPIISEIRHNKKGSLQGYYN